MRMVRVPILLLAGLVLVAQACPTAAQLPRARGPLAAPPSDLPDSTRILSPQAADSSSWVLEETPPDSIPARWDAAAPDTSQTGVPAQDLSMAIEAGPPVRVPYVPPRLPLTGIGLFLGYPSTLGIQIAAPADGALAFRSGLTGFPGVGILWTPGVEVRFSQEPGTYSTDSGYGFANLLMSRTFSGKDKDHVGIEAGLGYRWVLSDRRALRWIGGVEGGGHWDADSIWPDRPSLRILWMVAGL